MPAHNAAPYIRQAIRSILNQTFTDYELWVLENGSQDGTASVAGSISDSRLRVTELGPVGFAAALDFGLRRAQTPWLARMDADDICTPDRLEIQLRAANRHPAACIVGTNSATLSHSGHCIAVSGQVREQPLSFESVAIGGRGKTKSLAARYCKDASMLFRRDSALAAGGYDLEFKSADTALWLKMLRGSIGIEIPDVAYLYRALPSSLKNSHSHGLAVREKYAPDALAEFQRRFPSAPQDARNHLAGYWWQMFIYDSVANDDAAAFRSFEEYARHSGSIARWCARCPPVLRILSRAARHRSGVHYRHRPDLDQIVKEVSRHPSFC
jgi:glycosyltransferase involved in cell wall biosynthesis